MSKIKNPEQARVLAIIAPFVPASRINVFFDAILSGLNDQDENIRNYSVDAIKNINAFIIESKIENFIDLILNTIVCKEDINNGDIPLPDQLLSEEEKGTIIETLLEGVIDPVPQVSYPALRSLKAMSKCIPKSKKERVISVLINCAPAKSSLIRELSNSLLDELLDNKSNYPSYKKKRNMIESFQRESAQEIYSKSNNPPDNKSEKIKEAVESYIQSTIPKLF